MILSLTVEITLWKYLKENGRMPLSMSTYKVFIKSKKMKHIASGKEFSLTKKSYDYSGSLNQIDEIILLGMVKWRNEWWFSGVSFTQSFNADLILDEKIHYPVEALLTLSTTNNLIQPIY